MSRCPPCAIIVSRIPTLIDYNWGFHSHEATAKFGWFMVENPMNMDDLWVLLFHETSICCSSTIGKKMQACTCGALTMRGLKVVPHFSFSTGKLMVLIYPILQKKTCGSLRFVMICSIGQLWWSVSSLGDHELESSTQKDRNKGCNMI